MAHAKERLSEKSSNRERESRDLALLALGSIATMNTLARSLDSSMIHALQKIRDERIYLSMDFQNFEAFLDHYPYSPMRYKKFNYLENQLKREGEAVFDTLNRIGIPVSRRKLLAGETQLSIEGDEIRIGEMRADLSDLPMVKQLINEFAAQNSKLLAQKKAAEKRAESLNARIRQGTEEIGQLRKSLDEKLEEDTFGKAYMKTVGAMLNLIEEASALAISEKISRSEGVIGPMFAQFLELKKALGSNFSFEEAGRAKAMIPEEVLGILEGEEWED